MTMAVIARVALRAVAIGIAIVAMIDPVLTRGRTAPPVVVVARLASAAVAAAEQAIRAGLPDTDLIMQSAAGRRLPCWPDAACVIVADGSVDVDLPTDRRGPVSLVALDPAAGANVAVLSAVVPRTQHVAAAGVIHVEMRGVAVKGRRTELRVTDGAAVVGSAVHEWPSEGDTAVDIPWWPIAEGPRVLRVEAVAFEGEASRIDNAVDAGVVVSADRAPVLVFDARPSWGSTFARRALEDDPRFQVEYRVGLGRSLAAGTPGGRLDTVALDSAAVVIVGGPDGLSAADVAWLETYVRVRGGSLVLFPDGPPAGAAARLFGGGWTEHLEASPSPVGPLRASETLRLAAVTPFDLVLGSVKGSPALVLRPAGRGRIVVSGAMDAWRYRDVEGGAFDRFWRSTVAELAAVGAPLVVEFSRPFGTPGAAVPFIVRSHRMAATGVRAISATAACGERAAQAVRLWPGGPAGVFAGNLPIDGTAGCVLTVTDGAGPRAEAGIAVSAVATVGTSAVLAKLERYARETGGVVASAADLDRVVKALASAGERSEQTEATHPMRSPWWMSPFVACLAIEWWLRRREGLR